VLWMRSRRSDLPYGGGYGAEIERRHAVAGVRWRCIHMYTISRQFSNLAAKCNPRIGHCKSARPVRAFVTNDTHSFARYGIYHFSPIVRIF
jgi:hypothetical protein